MRFVSSSLLNLPRLLIPFRSMVATAVVRPEPQIHLGRTLPMVDIHGIQGHRINGEIFDRTSRRTHAQFDAPAFECRSCRQHAAHASQSRLPMTISALVPMSITSVSSFVGTSPEPITPATISPYPRSWKRQR